MHARTPGPHPRDRAIGSLTLPVDTDSTLPIALLLTAFTVGDSLGLSRNGGLDAFDSSGLLLVFFVGVLVHGLPPFAILSLLARPLVRVGAPELTNADAAAITPRTDEGARRAGDGARALTSDSRPCLDARPLGVVPVRASSGTTVARRSLTRPRTPAGHDRETVK